MPRLVRSPVALTLAALLLLLAACGGGGPDDRQPASSIAADPPSGTAQAPVSVTFSVTAGSSEVTAYRWFVNGVPAGSGRAVDHTFEEAGRYEVRLEASDESGTTSTTLDYTVLTNDAFDVVLVFEEGSFTARQRGMIEAAASRWEQLVVGDIRDNGDIPPSIRQSCLEIIGPVPNTRAPELRDVDFVDDLLVFVHLMEEQTQTLARAGPCYWNGRLPNYGSIEVNRRHLEFMTSNDALTEVMIHEMAHILGVGTLWRSRAEELLYPGLTHCNNSASEPELERTFVGAAAVTQYQALGGSGAPPVDPNCSHWKQDVFGNEALTPARTIGTADDHTPLSTVTLGSLADLGYEVDYAAADPYTLPVAPAHVPGGEHQYRHGEPFVLLPGL